MTEPANKADMKVYNDTAAGYRGDPYGVPLGVVPRVVNTLKALEGWPPGRVTKAMRVDPELTALCHDPIAACVDAYLLMERKARAFDKLMENASPALRALIDDALVKS